MAAAEDQESKNDEIDQFAKEFHLSRDLENEIRAKGINLTDLCSQSQQQIDDMVSELTNNEEEQEALKKAIEGWKSKVAAAKASTPKKDENGNRIYEIYVKTLSGNYMTMEVTKVMTIGDLKKAIERKENIAEKTQKLVYGANELADDKATMDECGLEAEAQLHIILTNKRSCVIL